jgi:hypothetical protein
MRSPEMSLCPQAETTANSTNPNLVMTPVLIFSSNGVKNNVYAYRDY